MNVGVIGLSASGQVVVDSLLRKTAHNLLVYDPDGRGSNRTVTVCETAAELCDKCGIIVIALASAADLTALCNGIAPFISDNQIFIDLTDTSPALAHTVANGMRRHGAQYIDCGIFGANGLTDPFILFAGGNGEAFAAVQPIIRCFAPDLRYMGPAGRGKAVRLLCRALAAQIQESIGETAALAASMGIDERYFLESLSAFAEIAQPLAALGGGEPAFSIQELMRDVAVVEEMSSRAALLRSRETTGKV
ncbi:NAD(P)-binding domain-containing protein [Oscillospiraceae bacterium PP1C4]